LITLITDAQPRLRVGIDLRCILTSLFSRDAIRPAGG
jgi:hypothetical protein